MIKKQFSAVIFDFDSTLSAVEGVDYLAELHGVGEEVRAITRSAMDTYSVSPDLYEKRLNMIQPVASDIARLTGKYRESLLPGVPEMVRALQSLGKDLYVISAGLYPAVQPVAADLGIPEERVFAIEIYFNGDGEYTDFDRETPLIGAGGKQAIIEKIQPASPVVFIGDGANDLAAQDVVERFVGYGGGQYRPSIESRCDYYVRESNFIALLPYILTEEELDRVNYQELYKEIAATL